MKRSGTPSNTSPVAKRGKSDGAPPNWEAQWASIERMRERREAPVDTVGCGELFDRAALPRVQRFQTLVALMLSSQTKDETTAAAMGNLKRWGLTAEHLAGADVAAIDTMIAKVGFHNTKAANLKLAAAHCAEHYGGDVPRSAEEAMRLRGVGPKMAHLLMLHAWDRCEGIGVDTHVHRIAGRLRWTRGSRAPEDTREALEAWLPRERWARVNWLLVGHGQTVCRPRAPLCEECEAAPLCPSSTVKAKKKQ